MNNKTKLSLLGWIVVIIVAVIAALYFSSIQLFLFQNATVFSKAYVSVAIIILMISGLYFVITNWVSTSQGTYSILQKQFHVTHIFALVMTITIVIVSNLFVKTDSDTSGLLLCNATLFIVIETVQILATVNWNEFKYKNSFCKSIRNVKAKLITTETDDKIKVK